MLQEHACIYTQLEVESACAGERFQDHWFMPVFSALKRRLKQENYKFEVNRGYTVRYRNLLSVFCNLETPGIEKYQLCSAGSSKLVS